MSGLPAYYQPPTRYISVASLVNYVCQMYPLTPEEFYSHQKNAPLPEARRIVANVLRRNTRFSLSQIARHIGKADHKTAKNLIDNFESHIASNPKMRGIFEAAETYFRMGRFA